MYYRRGLYISDFEADYCKFENKLIPTKLYLKVIGSNPGFEMQSTINLDMEKSEM